MIEPAGYTCWQHGFFERDEIDRLASANRMEASSAAGFQPKLLSAPTRDAVVAESKEVRRMFRTAKELAESTAQEVEWIARPWVAMGALTELNGQAKTSGKTTLLTFLVACVLEGEDFLGTPTLKSNVVYLTEQGDASFKVALRRAGLQESEGLHILSWKDVRQVPWPTVMKEAIEECKGTNSRLLIVDTLPQFAGMEGDGENSAGQALEAIRPLQDAAASGLAVVITRHERKSGGGVGVSGRGSSAFTGAADIVMALRRPEGNASPAIRVINAIGRFEETPELTTIELTDGGYRFLGGSEALGAHHIRDSLVAALPRDPERALSVEELISKTNLGRGSIQKALALQETDGEEVVRLGTGRKGSPFRYYLSEIPSASTPSLGLAE